MKKNKKGKRQKEKRYLPPKLEKYKIDELLKDWNFETIDAAISPEEPW